MSRAEEKRSGKMVEVKLECLVCHAQSSVELSPEKFKTLSASWKIEQDCDDCGKSTEWSFAQAAVGDEEQLDFWDWLATTGVYFEPPGAEPQHERRRERRIEIHTPLRIFTPEGEEEVISENFSKSGVCFSSKKAYQLGQSIQIELRPVGESSPQTKTATVVRANPLVDGRTLYGARLESQAGAGG